MTDKYLEKLLSRGIAPDLFEHEMFTNSKVLGRETGLEVIVGGDKASTDGKRVVLPALDKGSVVSNEAANVARGFVNHEAGHLRFTNRHTVNRFAKHEKHAAFLNGMEDVRVEGTFSNQYPGSKDQFGAAANATLKRFISQVKKGEIKVDDKSKLVPMATAWAGREMMGQVIEPDLMAGLKDMVGPDHWKVAEFLAEKAKDAKSTLDIGRLLENWLGKIDPETDAERKSDGGMAGDGSGMGSLGDSGDGSGGYHAPSMADAVSAALPAYTGKAGYSSKLHEDQVWEEFEEFATKACHGHSGMPDTGISIDDPNWLRHQSLNMPAGKRLRELGLMNIEHMRKNLGPAVRAVRQALERGLIVAKQRNWDPGQTRGHLDPKRLTTIMTGARNYKRVRSELEMIDTAVTLLIDMSGSMNGNKSIQAMRAAFVFSESLTKVGVPIEVLGFCSDRKPLSAPLSRDGIIDIPVFKKFNDHINTGMWKVAMSANATQTRQGGNNADGDSLLHAWQRLRKRSEPRKVLIVFSDGCPHTRGSGDESAHLKKVVNMLMAQGCECYGIGIMDESVKRFYDEHIVIHDAAELAKKGGEFLKNLLIPSSMRVRRARKELKKAA